MCYNKGILEFIMNQNDDLMYDLLRLIDASELLTDSQKSVLNDKIGTLSLVDQIKRAIINELGKVQRT